MIWIAILNGFVAGARLTLVIWELAERRSVVGGVMWLAFSVALTIWCGVRA